METGSGEPAAGAGCGAPAGAANTRKRATGEACRRGKRGKYTAVACDECKKRKLKCIPIDDAGCQRCINEEMVCVYAQYPKLITKEKGYKNGSIQHLQEEVAVLRTKVAELESNTAFVRSLKDCLRKGRWDLSPSGGENIIGLSPAGSQLEGAPKEPQFVGPTRSAFGIIIGERSLTRMGIPTFEPPPPSGAQSPIHEFSACEDYWQATTAAEVARLLTVFQEEVESVYPLTNIGEQSARADQILQIIRNGCLIPDGLEVDITLKDVDIAKVAVATAILLETHGKKDLSSLIIQSVENSLPLITRPEVNLKEIQLIAILSIYYFHSGDELFAWRTIGIAAREALEMGLHRKKSLFDNFQNDEARRLAIVVFWCVYVLDRRWSYGTSLSFALVDRDIDPQLPEPDGQYAYLRCMVGYGRLGSKLWDMISQFGTSPQCIPDETVRQLDLNTKEWLQTIPPELQLRHPRLGLAPQSQPPVVHRLRSLLYLRGNYTRTLIYRHYLLSAQSISANMHNARLVVDIAQDSIEVLVHLHSTSDIYSRQQSAFNYFLLSALSIIFLAVCHAADSFAGPCRKSFLDAVDLVRGFSRYSPASRRLWNTIRGLLPRLKSLGLQTSYETAVHGSGGASPANAAQAGLGFGLSHQMEAPGTFQTCDGYSDSGIVPDPDISSVPDMFQMGNELLSLFDAFGQGTVLQEGDASHMYPTGNGGLGGFEDETSRRFQGLI